MSQVREDIIKWLHDESHWVQIAAEKILRQEEISEEVINQIKTILTSGVNEPIVDFSFFHDSTNQHADLIIKSIGNIVGIDNLAPKTPLEFISSMSVIYGDNGSGKSGYARILKKACGQSNSIDLKPNVFRPMPDEQKCEFVINENGDETVIEWVANSDPVKILKVVDIFDSQSGQLYLNKESEVSYTPVEVSLFEQLADLYTKLKNKFDGEKSLLTTKLPLKPIEYDGTKYIKAIYERLKYDTNLNTLKGFFSYTDLDEVTKQQLEERLKLDPNTRIKQKQSQIEHINWLIKSFNDSASKISKESCQIILNLKAHADLTRKIAVEGTKAIQQHAVLDGFGEETWKAMWQAAREYSNGKVYPEIDFPNIDENSRCVLCHQLLGDEAKHRMQEFDEFITGKLETEAAAAELKYKSILDNLPQAPSNDLLKTKIHAAQLDEDLLFPKFSNEWKSIETVVTALKEKQIKQFEGFFLAEDIFSDLKSLISRLEKEVKQHEQDAVDFDEKQLEFELKELNAKKWASGYIDVIFEEVNRLIEVNKYSEWIASVNTRRISTKIRDISESMITKAYIKRFNNELKALGANNISVELIKARVSSGKIMHKVQICGLDDAHNRIAASSILSEGEQRIVTLAAFLADVTAKPSKSPFIFDDPISSLDQKYEEKTAKRLIELSKEKQVIVFTHRLSLLGLLNDLGNPDCKYLRHETWGCGEHGRLPFFAKNPIKAVKNLRNEWLPKAKNAFEEDGYESYYPLAKAICSDFRILLERIIEDELLADVIKRHRREVHTKNKIGKLAKICVDDCNLIQRLMTDFSAFEHSQSSEMPVEMPEPSILDSSLACILDWHDEFKNRETTQ